MEHHGREVPSPNLPADSCEPRIYRALAAADRLAEALHQLRDADNDTSAVTACTALDDALSAHLAERGR